jgi:hypothetical protein
MALTRISGNLISSGTVTGASITSNSITSTSLSTTGVTSGVYGGAGAIPIITVDSVGRITNAVNVAISSTSNTANNLAAGSAGTIPYQTGAGATAMLATGTAGQVLTSNGTNAPTWSTISTLYTSKTSAYTAVAGDNILANTSAGSFAITLPASPTTGQSIQIVDAQGTFQQYPLTVARNGKKIMSLEEDLYIGTSGAGFGLLYNGTEWRII